MKKISYLKKQEKLFEKDLTSIQNIYSHETIEEIKKNKNLLIKEYIKWNNSTIKLAKKFDVPITNIKNIPYLLEKRTFNIIKKTRKNNSKKIILGIAGPGAVGKETLKKELGFNMIINTTTRKKRSYEIQNKHYHFISNKEFKKIKNNDGFIIQMYRPGRGNYGIQKNNIKKIINKSKISIIEENPKNLNIIKKYLESIDNYDFILIYILPPYPIFSHLVCRLVKRCKNSNDNFKNAIESTLGKRQLDELNFLINLKNKNLNIFILINDEIDRAVKKIKIIF